ncbi:hypothetical protein LLH23_03115 [bacterium]|nr:hypothetical protein [bacterium]
MTVDHTGPTPAVSEKWLELIAKIIANTRRRRRKLNLTELAEVIEEASALLGGLVPLAETVSLSEEMLREFLLVKKLVPRARELVRSRQIDSVDAVRSLSQLRPQDQEMLAEAVISGRFTTDDARAAIAFMKAMPETDMGTILDMIDQSRNIVEYVAEVVVPPATVGPESLRERFADIVGEENVRTATVEGRVALIGLSAAGRRRLQMEAKRRRMTKRALIHELTHKGA